MLNSARPPRYTRRQFWILVALVTVTTTVLFSCTLMVTISGCDQSEYCSDVGEFQVGLAT